MEGRGLNCVSSPFLKWGGGARSRVGGASYRRKESKKPHHHISAFGLVRSPSPNKLGRYKKRSISYTSLAEPGRGPTRPCALVVGFLTSKQATSVGDFELNFRTV